MKHKIFLTIKIVLALSILSFFIPMPHGGTIGGNLTEGLEYELANYFSSESTLTRKEEKKERVLQEEKATKSWKKFYQENPQYSPRE